MNVTRRDFGLTVGTTIAGLIMGGPKKQREEKKPTLAWAELPRPMATMEAQIAIGEKTLVQFSTTMPRDSPEAAEIESRFYRGGSIFSGSLIGGVMYYPVIDEKEKCMKVIQVDPKGGTRRRVVPMTVWNHEHAHELGLPGKPTTISVSEGPF